MLKNTYIGLLILMLNLDLYLGADTLPEAVFLPPASVAVIDDALATIINPAGLGVRSGANGYYLHTFSGEVGGDNAFFASFQGTGFGAEFVDSGPLAFSKYTLSDGLRLFNGMYFGLSYAWFNSKDKAYDKLSSWDAGLLYRSFRPFSVGFVARNLKHPIFGDSATDRIYNLSFAFRPYTNRVTLSVDSEFQEGHKAEDTKLTYAMECEPVDGIILKGNYDSDGNYGVGFELGFPQFQIGVCNRLSSNGGVVYTRFTKERYRTKLRPGHYVLEVDSEDLTSWRMQDSILHRAKKDNAVDGIILKLGFGQYSFGELQEIRDALLDFRSSGKKAVCYMELAGNKEYYLATACNRILLNPAGYLSLNGLRSEVSFYKSALDKLGIDAELYHIGKYKSASEAFTRDSMSDTYRESLNSILDDIDCQMVSQIAEGRGMSVAQVRKKIDEGPYTPKGSIEDGLVDDLSYKDQLKEVRERIFGKRSVKLSGREYGNYKYHEYNWGTNPKLAVIYASGLIAPGKSMGQETDSRSLISIPRLMGSETMADAIKSAREDRAVKAIVLKIDSGGGSVFASDIIWRELMLTKGKKPLIVSMGGVAASGGYYIACPGDIILAEPGTITGSIGVIAGKFSLRGLYDQLGINKEILKRGRNSDFYSSYSVFTQEQQEIVKHQIQEIYDDFVAKVAQGRNMTEEAVEEVAQGRVWTGKQAKGKGLVDELGGIHLALSIARSKAGLKQNENLDIITLPKPVPIWQRLIYGNTPFLTLDIVKTVERLANDRIFFIIPYDLDIK